MNKRDIILNNYENPFNKKLINNNSYIKENLINTICVDEIDVMLKIENDIIKDIMFDGEACIIVISSTSILLKLLIGKTIKQALEIIENYQKMIKQKKYVENILGDLIVYKDIYLQPNRIECALLSANGIKKIIEKL